MLLPVMGITGVASHRTQWRAAHRYASKAGTISIMKDKAEEELEAKGTEDGSGPAQGRGGGVGKTGAPSC